MKRTRAIGIVLEKGQILLMYRKLKGKEYFVFPGGGVDSDESVEEAVVREIAEESSLTVKVDRLLYRLTDENSEHHFYVCTYLSGESVLGYSNERERMTEENQYRPEWHAIDTLSKTPLYPLEVRDWLINDLSTGFKEEVRHDEILISERREI